MKIWYCNIPSRKWDIQGIEHIYVLTENHIEMIKYKSEKKIIIIIYLVCSFFLHYFLLSEDKFQTKKFLTSGLSKSYTFVSLNALVVAWGFTHIHLEISYYGFC